MQQLREPDHSFDLRQPPPSPFNTNHVKAAQMKFQIMQLVASLLLALPAARAASIPRPPAFPHGFPSTKHDLKSRNQFLPKTPFERAHFGDNAFLPNIVGGRVVDPPFKYSSWMGAIMVDDFQFCAGTLYGRDETGAPLFVTAGRRSCGRWLRGDLFIDSESVIEHL